MKAEENKSYAIVDSGFVIQVFDKDTMPCWNEDDIDVIECDRGTAVGDRVIDGKVQKAGLKELIRRKVVALNRAFDIGHFYITCEYVPLVERLTWGTQEREAEAYIKTRNIDDAPSLSLIAKARGVSVDYLASKCIEKSRHYSEKLNLLIGKRQAILKEIEAAGTLLELEKIHIPHRIDIG